MDSKVTEKEIQQYQLWARIHLGDDGPSTHGCEKCEIIRFVEKLLEERKGKENECQNKP